MLAGSAEQRGIQRELAGVRFQAVQSNTRVAKSMEFEASTNIAKKDTLKQIASSVQRKSARLVQKMDKNSRRVS